MGTKVKNTIPLTIGQKNMKHVGVNLEKYVSDLYTENYKILMKYIF